MTIIYLRQTLKAEYEKRFGLTSYQQAKNKTDIRQFPKLKTSQIAFLMLLETFYLFVFSELICKIPEYYDRAKSESSYNV